MNKQELATKIWATANALRKNIKASEYKDYILGFMFYKYLCDKEIDYLKDREGDVEDIKDADEETKMFFRDNIGYFISYENLFSTWKKEGGNLGAKDVSEALEDFYANLKDKYKTVFDGVFSALQSGLTKLGENSGSRDKAVRDIVDIVDEIPPTSKDFDVLGYIYEYLIQQFSSEAKKDGAFYTPHEVTALMARIIAHRLQGRKQIEVYDPCIGSGGLLLTIGREAGKYISHDNIKYYGQELITETANLAKMNLFMQGIPVQNITVRNADSLGDDWPYFDANTQYTPLFVDACSANPPYSVHADLSDRQSDERFKNYGIPPESKADYAFLLHCLYHIKQDGIMAIVLPHGVLFRGGSEGEIRKKLVLEHNIETIISLPASLFFATGIPVIVMILSKNRKADDILFVDASQSFRKEKKQNVLTESDVQRIFDTVIRRKSIPNYAYLAPMSEIAKNDYNLNVTRYVSSTKQEVPYDLYSVMTGYVSETELESFKDIWNAFPKLKEELLEKNGEYYRFKDVECKKIVNQDEEVKKYHANFQTISKNFREEMKSVLIGTDQKPMDCHSKIVEELFEQYRNDELADVYDVYQAFADNWPQVESDLYRIHTEGFDICSQTEPNMVTKKDSKTKQTVEEQKGWKGKVLPFDLVKETYFTADFEKMNHLTSEEQASTSEYTDIWENLDEDIKHELVSDKDETKYDTKKIKAAIKAKQFDDEVIDNLKQMLEAMDQEKEYKKASKTISDNLENKAKEKLESLSKEEVEELLEKKWIDPILSSINGVSEGVLNQFVANFELVKKKYSDPMASLTKQIEETTDELKKSMADLTGSDSDMEAIRLLMEEL